MKKCNVILFGSLLLLVLDGCIKKEELKQPQACFTPSKNTAAIDEIVTFDNCSTDANRYGWDFGDGTTSTDISPAHSYTQSGQKIVKLKAFNQTLYDEITQVITIEPDQTQTPTSCFTLSASEVKVGDVVQFTNCSTNASSYAWDFGDGTSSTQTSPSHTYQAANTYTVILTAQNGSDYDEVSHQITVSANIEACFTISPNPATIGQNVTFTNCSVNATSYDWDMDGNGTIDSHDTNPVFYYNVAGTFNVKLSAKNGSDSEEVVHTITINGASVTACFTMSATTANVGETVIFTNCSTNATSYEWDADGDGTIDYTTKDLSIYYNYAGTYNIKLIARNGSEFDTEIKTIVINQVEIDPTVYDLPINWTNYYSNEFTASGDWSEGTTSDYSAIISGGVYSIINYNTSSPWFFWTNVLSIPDTSVNYDYEIKCKIDYDNVTQGSGIFSSFNETSSDQYFFKYTEMSGIGYYTYGNKNNSPWDVYGTGGNIGIYNKLTIRKYKNNVYFFLNQNYINSVPFEGNYGGKFGFVVGADSKMTTEWISIWNMGPGSNKSADTKPFAKFTGVTPQMKGKAFVDRERSHQTGKQAKKQQRLTPTLK